MKKRIMSFCALLLISLLWAVENDNKAIFVPTGWTSEKEATATQWTSMTNPEKENALFNLQIRYNNLLPDLPADVYSREENQYVGYRARLQRLWQELQSQRTSWYYAEFVYLLNEAENYLHYLLREKSLPKNESDTDGLTSGPWQKSDRTENRQGTGWDLGYVDLSLVDHITPSVTSFNNYVFIAASNQTSEIGNDTMFLWRSTDYGNSWERWHSYGTSTADRPVFDIAIDPVNQYLYETYTYITPTNTGDIWLRRFTDLNNSSSTSIYNIENTSDECGQPHLSVEHEWSEHRLCCIYHNYTTGNVVIARSTDLGQTWTTVYTSPWTTSSWAIPKGAQGAVSQTTDKFVFVARKSNNSLVILESISGGTGTWIETEYVHSQAIDNIDVSASHNHNQASVVVAFSYPWTSTDYNIRILFRMEDGPGFVSKLVDGDVIMTKTPVITCDGEYAGNNPGPDYYHLSYYKNHNGDNYYIPFALRCLNDSTLLANMSKTNPSYFEVVGANIIDTLTSDIDYGRPLSGYQIDMTSVWNATHNQWFPVIVWMRYYPGTGEADPRLSFPDETHGIPTQKNQTVPGMIISLCPNPSSGNFKLTYQLRNKGNVKISLYDATGRMVCQLMNAFKPQGTHSININKADLSNGIYFITIDSSESKTIEKIVIIK